MGRAPLFAVALAALVMLAGTADACPVCFQAKNDASRVAFIATTAFLTGLPLLLVGGVAWWLRRRFLESAQREQARLTQTGSSTSGDVERPGRLAALS